MPKRLSNHQIGDQHIEVLRRWLEAAECIPDRGGVANISAIAVATGLDRQVLYRDEARALISAAVAQKGLGMPQQQRTHTDEVPQWAKEKIHELEQRLATLYAELGEARRKLARYEHLERHMTATGVLPR